MTMRTDSSGKLHNSAIVLRLAIEFQKTFKTILPCQDLPSVYRGRWLWWAFASAEPQFLFWNLNDSPPYPDCIYTSTTPSSLVQHIHIVFVCNAIFFSFSRPWAASLARASNTIFKVELVSARAHWQPTILFTTNYNGHTCFCFLRLQLLDA